MERACNGASQGSDITSLPLRLLPYLPWSYQTFEGNAKRLTVRTCTGGTVQRQSCSDRHIDTKESRSSSRHGVSLVGLKGSDMRKVRLTNESDPSEIPKEQAGSTAPVENEFEKISVAWLAARTLSCTASYAELVERRRLLVERSERRRPKMSKDKALL